jgi:hypothetical protein
VDQITDLAGNDDSPSRQSAAEKCAKSSETAIFASALGESPTSPVNASRYTAIEQKATLVTGDSDFRKLGHVFPVIWLKN